MNARDVADVLADSSLFAGASPEVLASIATEVVPREFGKGTIVVSEGELAETCYVMVSGSAKVYVSSPHGQELVLATMRPPDAFGVLALLDGGTRSASVETLEHSTMLALAQSTFVSLIERDPSVAKPMLVSIGRLARKLTTQAADLVFLDLEGRVAKLLVSIAERDAPGMSVGPVQLDLGVTQSDLAAMVGGSRQSVNHILHALEARTYLEMDRQTVTILDLDALRRRGAK
jgi:CRP/FNR family transcriptional regulator, cyclic AMP receptor protein